MPKIVSWNMQGGSSNAAKPVELHRLMGQEDVVAICLQECGDLSGWQVGQQIPTETSWTVVCHEVWGQGNNRCSLAILARQAVGSLYRRSDANNAQRPVIGAKISDALWVFTVHAPAGGDGDPVYVKDALVSAQTQAAGLSWLLAGDFNINGPPSADTLGVQGIVPSHYGGPTHQGGKELDYAYGNMPWKAEFLKIGTSDHASLSFELL